MAEFLLNNPIALRQCILYEVLSELPIFGVYRMLCTRLGQYFMTYQDFEYWFRRFQQKLYDLNYDRSQDPKCRGLVDLPDNLLNKIVDEVKPEDRLILQKVSKPLRQLLLDRDPGFRKIRVSFTPHVYDLVYDECRIEYGDILHEEEEKDNEYYGKHLYWLRKKERILRDSNFSQLAAYDLGIVLSNPKLRLEKFKFCCNDDKFWEVLQQKLAVLERKIDVNLEISTRSMEIINVLKYFNFKKLTIDLGWYYGIKEQEERKLDQILLHPDIQRAEMVKLENFNFDSLINSLVHCPRITIAVFKCTLTVEKAEKLKNVILNSTVLEIFNVERVSDEEVDTLFRQFGPNAVQISENPKIIHFPVPETDRIIELKMDEKGLFIKRLA